MTVLPTPGPWRVELHLIRGEVRNFYIQAGATNIATIPALSDNDEDAANARLIAAAPDMLTALEAILDVGLSEQTFAMGFKAVAKARNQGEAPPEKT